MTYAQPQEIKTAPAWLGALLPPMDEIPEDFHRECTPEARKWIELQQRWFFHGLKGATFIPREGVDVKIALRHLSVIQASFEPLHEHKQAAVAWLMSLWFTDVVEDEA